MHAPTHTHTPAHTHTGTGIHTHTHMYSIWIHPRMFWRVETLETLHYHLLIALILVTLLHVLYVMFICTTETEVTLFTDLFPFFSRVIFNFIHGAGIGFITEILARKPNWNIIVAVSVILSLLQYTIVTNVGLGIALFQSNCGGLTGSRNHILWIYLAWVVFLLIFQIGQLFTYTISSILNKDASGSNKTWAPAT